MNKRQAINNMLTIGAYVVSEQKRRHHQVRISIQASGHSNSAIISISIM